MSARQFGVRDFLGRYHVESLYQHPTVFALKKREQTSKIQRLNTTPS